jgi:hypothetical protein
MSADYKDIKHLLDLSEQILSGKELSDDLNEETNSERLEKEMAKTDSELMKRKVEKLNLLIKKKYYEADEDLDESKMFEFQFQDKGDHYEFGMPLSIVFGKRARQFAARYWNDLFDSADIRVSFEDNIEDALKRAGAITLSMKINKSMTKEA